MQPANTVPPDATALLVCCMVQNKGIRPVVPVLRVGNGDPFPDLFTPPPVFYITAHNDASRFWALRTASEIEVGNPQFTEG